MSTIVKERFVRDLIRELNDINERERVYDNKRPLDVCYMVSVVDRQIENCKEFIDDISKNAYYINGYEEDNTEGYTNGKIRILIEKPEEERESEMMYHAFYDYCYYIEFTYDERMWGYCDCSPEDSEYIEEIRCCGVGCDWTAPSFRLEKSISLGGGRWDGYERDYWEYKKKFNENEFNKNKEVEEFKKKQEKERLEMQLLEIQEKLTKL